MTTLGLALRLQDAYKNKKFSDVTLLCKDAEALSCHSIVLQLSSNFFEQKLSNKWNEADNSADSNYDHYVVDCTNFELSTVKLVVNFMYDIKIDINCENVSSLLNAGSYFIINDLVNACKLFLEKSISETNVFTILTISDNYVLNDVKNNCLIFIDSCFVSLCSNFVEDFYNLPLMLMVEIVKRDTLVVSEEFLFDVLSVFCFDHEDGHIWSKFTPYIRFCFMNISFFSSKCVFDTILPSNISNKIFKFLSSTEIVSFEDEDEFSKICTPRICTAETDVVIRRFLSNTTDCIFKCNVIDGERLSFIVSDQCFLRTIGIFTKKDTSYMVRLKLFAFTSGTVLSEIQRRIVGEDGICMLQLRSPVSLSVNVLYTLQLFLEGGNSVKGIYGSEHRHCINASGQTLNITFTRPYGGNTTVSEGQFPVFVFCK